MNPSSVFITKRCGVPTSLRNEAESVEDVMWWWAQPERQTCHRKQCECFHIELQTNHVLCRKERKNSSNYHFETNFSVQLKVTRNSALLFCKSPIAQSEECLLNTQEVPGSKPGWTNFLFSFFFLPWRKTTPRLSKAATVFRPKQCLITHF